MPDSGNTEIPLVSAGADGTIIEEFRALAESGKYSTRPTLERFAIFLVGTGGGAKKDTPLFELCHLITAVGAMAPGDDERALFFLAPDRALPGVFRDWFLDRSDDGEANDMVSVTGAGIDITLPDGEFSVRYGRMPFLAALYEFLSALEGFGYYRQLNQLLDEMAEAGDRAAIQGATNKLSSRLRQYRKEHLAVHRHDNQFNLAFRYLKENGDGSRLKVDDAAIIGFWLLHSHGGESTMYETVYRLFMNFTHVLDDVGCGSALHDTKTMGTDQEQGEIDPEDMGEDAVPPDDWVSPLAILDEEPANRVKFFKGASEADPMERLMEFGPKAIAWPLAFLRLDCFGPVQTSVRNDRQFKRGEDAVVQRLDCADVAPYRAKIDLYTGLLDHVRQLQKAAFHALTAKHNDEEVVPRTTETIFDQARSNDETPDIDESKLDDVRREAEIAFRRMTRKGFDEAMLDEPDHVEAFRIGAGALLAIATQLERFLAVLEKLDKGDSNLDRQFEDDREIFVQQFRKIYGVPA